MRDTAHRKTPLDGTAALEREAVLAFLRRPSSYPFPTSEVARIETHMAWVFMTDTRAYKLKKPVRYAYLDFSTLEARRRNCEEEVRLNRRLAPDIYLGTVPLTRTSEGALRLGGEGRPVEWLTEMRRLPAERMLDRAIRDGTWRLEDLEALGRLLADFFGRATPEPLTSERYTALLRADVEENRRELVRESVLASRRPGIEALADGQLAFLRACGSSIEARVRERRVVEGHGDLRPEHICLGPPLAVIDCIEFNRAFRILDAADELAYLRLECERLGDARPGEVVLGTYRRTAPDAPPPPLMEFYMSHRAFLRAKIAVWHLRDDQIIDLERWRSRAETYLDLAESHLRQALAD